MYYIKQNWLDPYSPVILKQLFQIEYLTVFGSWEKYILFHYKPQLYDKILRGGDQGIILRFHTES